MTKQNKPAQAAPETDRPQKTAVKTVVQLLKPHTHVGRIYPIDARLELDADSAQWLITIGTAKEFSPR